MTPATNDNGQWLSLAIDIGKWVAGGILSIGIWLYIRRFPDRAWVMKQIGLAEERITKADVLHDAPMIASVEQLRYDVATNRARDKADLDEYRHALKADLDRLQDRVEKSITEQTRQLIEVILKRRA